MRAVTRVVTAGVAASVVAIALGTAPVGATTAGVSTTTTKTSVLTFTLGQGGSLLDLGLLTDSGGANIDSHSGTPQATASLVPVTLSSSLLHLNLSTPAITTLSPGGAGDAASQAITLTGLGVPAALATATIKPAALHSDFTSLAAHSTMTAAEIDNLTLAGGALASINLLASNLGADALTASGDGTRGVNIGSVNLLDLGAFLKGIGVDLGSLPVSTLSNLLKSLGVPVTGLPAGTSLSTEVGSLTATLANLEQSLVGATTAITAPLTPATQGILGNLNLPIPTVGSTVQTVQGVITSVTSTLTGLLTSALSGIDSFPLLQISGTSAGILTKAADTVANSAAAVTVAPLSITAAGVKLPAIDPTAVVNTINGVIAQANGALNTLLSGSLGLPANLLSLSLLDKATSVTQNGAYTNAAAGLNVLTLKVAGLAPTVITNAVKALGGTPVGSLLGSTPLGGLLTSSSAMGTLNTLLGQTAPLLTGAQLQIASLAGDSTYTAVAAASSTPRASPSSPAALPHTGANPEVALLGLLVAAFAIGALRYRRLGAHAGPR